MGLRETKKLATKKALAIAALRLATERGLAQVRVEDIAAAADVSPRTFNNYFSSKEEAIVSIAAERVAGVAMALRERPQDEPLAVALCQAFVAQFTDCAEQDRQWITQIRLAASTPELQGEYLRSLARSERALAEAIADRTGQDAAHDLYPRVLAAAVFGAGRVAVQHWLTADRAVALADVVQQAFEQVVNEAAAQRIGEP